MCVWATKTARRELKVKVKVKVRVRVTVTVSVQNVRSLGLEPPSIRTVL